jgi:uncharacterized protein
MNQMSMFSRSQSKRRALFSFSILSTTLILGACNSTDIKSARLPYEAGAFQEAAEIMVEIHPQDGDGAASDNRSEDNIWLLIEKGKMLLDAGQFEASNVAFYEANRIFETLDEEATVSLGAIQSGAASLAFDDCQADYVGNSYDRILLPSYVALNHLMLGQFDRAAVASRQQLTWQMKAEEARATETARIIEMDDEAQKTGLGFTSANAAQAFESQFADASEADNESPQDTIRRIRSSTSEWASESFSDFSIPFGRFVGALALASNGNAGEAGDMLNVVRGMVPSCPPLRQPLLQGRTAYVIFENGLAPKRSDETVDFVYWYTGVVPILNEAGDKIGEKEVNVPSRIVLPFVGLRSGRTNGEDEGIPAYTPGDFLRIDGDGQTSETSQLHELGSVVAREFDDALPAMITRTMIRAGIQEVAQIAANNEFGFWAVLFGAVVKGTIDPDLRGWESLGAQHQLAVVSVPDNGILNFSVIGSSGDGVSHTITVPVGPPVLVYARSTNQDNLIVHSCPLTPGALMTP